MIYKAMNFTSLNAGDYVMKFGEKGSTFYIILRGKVAVRVQCNVERNFEFRELLELLHSNQEWTIQNEHYEETLKLILELFPELIKITHKGDQILNYDLLGKVLANEVVLDSQKRSKDLFPTFEDLKLKIEGPVPPDAPPPEKSKTKH